MKRIGIGFKVSGQVIKVNPLNVSRAKEELKFVEIPIAERGISRHQINEVNHIHVNAVITLKTLVRSTSLLSRLHHV